MFLAPDTTGKHALWRYFAVSILTLGAIRVLPFYFGLGVFFGVLAILDDGLELGTGCHLGNNLFVSIILSNSNGAVNTPSLLRATTETIIDAMWVLIVVIPIVMALLNWRYKFNWTKLLRS